MMPPLGSWQMLVMANWELPPPAGSMATMMWFVLPLEMAQKISIGICVIMFFMKRSTSVEGKALVVASAEMPIDSRSLPTQRRHGQEGCQTWGGGGSHSMAGSSACGHTRAPQRQSATRAQGTSAGALRTSSERTTSIFCDESQRGILRNTTGRMSATEHRHRSSTVQISALGQLVRAPEMEKCGEWRDASSCPTGHAHFSGVSVLRHSSQTRVMEMVSKSLPPVESVSSNILPVETVDGVHCSRAKSRTPTKDGNGKGMAAHCSGFPARKEGREPLLQSC